MYNGDDESQNLSMSDYSSIDIRNERFNNSIFNNNDTNVTVDKGHHRIYRKVNNKTVPIYIYTTRYTPGSRIRNAVSGFSDKHIVVGTKDEDLFFKVSLSTGELGGNPYGNHLYYDSPEQYEKHFYTTIHDKRIKDTWWKKYRLNQKNKELDDINRPEFTIIH